MREDHGQMTFDGLNLRRRKTLVDYKRIRSHVTEFEEALEPVDKVTTGHDLITRCLLAVRAARQVAVLSAPTDGESTGTI